MEEFEKLLAESFQSDMIPGEGVPESLSLPLTAGDDSSAIENGSSETAPEAESTSETADSALAAEDPALATKEEEAEMPAAIKPE
jgi:hypothetical protein